MKIQKYIGNLFKPKQVKQAIRTIPPCPIEYNPNNVTADEFKKYIHWLAENNINRTIQEPDRFVSPAERKAMNIKNAELEEYRQFVRYLAKTDSDRTFWC